MTLIEPADLIELDWEHLEDENPDKVIYKKSSTQYENYDFEKDPMGFDIVFSKVL